MIAPSPNNKNRSIRIFISSTFKDMIEERDELMTQCWPQLRSYCKERHVDFVEVDLRWGISEEQSKRKETLKLCLDEIKRCRPFFIGILGERYGWIPEEDSFTGDLLEEQKWLKETTDKSVTELEILHGVLRNPNMAGRSYFYFRDPNYVNKDGNELTSESEEDSKKRKLRDLKDQIRIANEDNRVRLTEDYENPARLAQLVLDDLKAAIEAEFPLEQIPDPITREAMEHDSFAESRRKTYIGRQEYYDKLNNHTLADRTPLVITGESGSGKTALLANWAKGWKQNHPEDFVFEHYIGGTNQSADHWSLMNRLMAEIKRWTEDPGELPKSHDDMLRDFGSWLVRLRLRAELKKVQAVLVIDALNQLEDKDHVHVLGWLPEYPFFGPLRMVVSTLSGPILEVCRNRNWPFYSVKALEPQERKDLITDYLKRFSKALDEKSKDLIISYPATNNPLYLKILLDELRITGTHDQLEKRIRSYLQADSIPNLIEVILDRYRRDYDRDIPELVSDTLGLILSARRGLSESELLELLKPDDKAQLPQAKWNPLRSALDEWLITKNGILNFSHGYIRDAVGKLFVPDLNTKDDFQLRLADYFEKVEISERSCDELPWLLKKTESFERLRNCLLDIHRFKIIYDQNKDELRSYWVFLGEEREMGIAYLQKVNPWISDIQNISYRDFQSISSIGLFLFDASLFSNAEPIIRSLINHAEIKLGSADINTAHLYNNLSGLLLETNRHLEAEPLNRRVIEVYEIIYGKEHPRVAMALNNLAGLLFETNRHLEAEPLYRRALEINKKSYGADHPYVALTLINLASLLLETNRHGEAEHLDRRALEIYEKSYGKEHPQVAWASLNLATVLDETNRYREAEPLIKRAIGTLEKSYGKDHPKVATALNNLAGILQETGRYQDAELHLRISLEIHERNYGREHPKVANSLNNLGQLLHETNRIQESELLCRRSMEIYENSYGKDHPKVATALNNLAEILRDTGRYQEAEPLYIRELGILEMSYGKDHPKVAVCLDNLGVLLSETNRFGEAQELCKRSLDIKEKSYGKDHPDVALSLNNLGKLLLETNRHLEAEPLLKRSLEIREKSYGKDHPKVATALINLGELLHETNRGQYSESLYRRALEIYEKSYGIDHPDVALALNSLAALLLETKRYLEAEPLYIRALEICEKSFGKGHPKVAATLSNLAEVLRQTNRHQEAEPLYKRAIDILEKSHGNDHPKVALALNNLAALLLDTKRYREAERLYKKVIDIFEKSCEEDDPRIALSIYGLASLLNQTNRHQEAEPRYKRALEILLSFSRKMGHAHHYLRKFADAYGFILMDLGCSKEEAIQRLHQIAPELFSKN